MVGWVREIEMEIPEGWALGLVTACCGFVCCCWDGRLGREVSITVRVAVNILWDGLMVH